MTKMSFANQVVVITGGSSGIGKQLAVDFSRLGAHCIICSRASTVLIDTQAEFQQTNCNVDVQECDVRDTGQVHRLANHVLTHYGQIDILLNNAGYGVYRPFEESSLDEVLDLLDVNLAGAMRCAKAFLPSMVSNRSGRIVNISSIGGETIITPNAVYCAAKHGMVAWTKAIRYELAHYNVKVNVICPGHTKTNFHDHPTFRRRDPYRRKTARSMTVEKVSAVTLDAILKDRVLTYIPWWQKWVAWMLNAAPIISVPIWDRITQKRIAQLYEQLEQEQKNG